MLKGHSLIAPCVLKMDSIGEEDAFVPCEVCDTMVRFSCYVDHVRQCTQSQNPSVLLNMDSRVLNFQLQDPDVGLVNIPIPSQLLQSLMQRRHEGEGEGEGGEGEDDTVIEEEGEDDTRPRSDTGSEEGARRNRPLLWRLELLPLLAGAIDGMDEAEPGNGQDYEFNLLLSEIVGQVEQGVRNLDAVCCDASPPGPENKPEKEDENENENICAICRETLFRQTENNENVPVSQLLCKHMFCKECIIPWLQKHRQCPLCMCDLDDMYDKQQKSGYGDVFREATPE